MESGENLRNETIRVCATNEPRRLRVGLRSCHSRRQSRRSRTAARPCVSRESAVSSERHDYSTVFCFCVCFRLFVLSSQQQTPQTRNLNGDALGDVRRAKRRSAPRIDANETSHVTNMQRAFLSTAREMLLFGSRAIGLLFLSSARLATWACFRLASSARWSGASESASSCPARR